MIGQQTKNNEANDGRDNGTNQKAALSSETKNKEHYEQRQKMTPQPNNKIQIQNT